MSINFSIENKTSLQLTRYHSGMADKHSALEQAMNKHNVIESTQTITNALREFEEFSRNDRERFLLGGLTQTTSDQAVCEWVAARYDHLSRIAREVVPYKDHADIENKSALVLAWAQALLLTGHASKWRKIAGLKPDLAMRGRLHKLYVTAIQAELDDWILEVSVDRRSIEVTIEALYVRSMLLERFASGNLSPRRLEILDSWLLAWIGELWLSRQPILNGPSLAINVRNPNQGLTRYQKNEHSDFFLSMKPLQIQLKRATREFHRGVIFPGWGTGLIFRMEDHVAVIEFLEREFDMIETAGAQKSKRFAIGRNSEVSIFVGFNDIYSRALPRQTTLADHSTSKIIRDNTSMNSGQRATLSNTGGMVQSHIWQPIHLLDISETGLGLEMDTEDAIHVEIDELIAVQIEATKPCVLGIVARKTRAHERSVTVIGVKVLSMVPLRATMEMVDDRLVRQSVKGIFVAGKADHGFADSVIVPDLVYKAGPTLSVMVASGMFHLRLGRVRQSGPGWKLAALEARVAH